MASTYERNDGTHNQTGLPVRTTCTHTWADEWLGELDHDEIEGAREKYASEIEAINAAETRFFACSPESRTAARDVLSATGPDEWEDVAVKLKTLAAEAERQDAEECRGE